MLSDYSDTEVVELLEYGFPIGFFGKLSKNSEPVQNHKGVTQFPDEVQKYLSKEKQYGAILGPFEQIPFFRGVLHFSIKHG